MEKRQTSVPDLVSLSLFQIEPRIASSKGALWRSLVDAAMYHEAKPLSKQQLTDAVKRLLQQPNIDIQRDIDEAVTKNVEMGVVEVARDQYSLTTDGRDRVEAVVNRAKSDEGKFDEELGSSLVKELGYPLSQSEMLIVSSAVKYSLGEFFRAKGVEVERARVNDSLTLDEVLVPGGVFDPTVAIRAKLTTVIALLGPDTGERIVAGVKRTFRDLSVESRRYVSSLHHRVFYHQILNLDPGLHNQEREYFASTKLYLDTNVLIAYLFSSTSRHQVTRELVSASKNMGFQVLVSPATCLEMKGFIAAAQPLYPSLGADARVSRLLTETSKGRQSNPVLVTFLMQRKRNLNLSWDQFLVPYQKLEDLLLQESILVDDDEFSGVRGDEHYNKVWHTIRDIRYPEYPDKIVDHDADNFVLVHRLREIYNTHPMGQKVWLLSWDSNLCKADKVLSHDYPAPHCRLLEDWGQFLLAYQNVNDFIFDDYVLYLVKSALGLTVDEDGLDLDLLETLHRPEYDVDLLLSVDDPTFVAETLAAMQRNREVRRLAESARKTKDPEEIKQISHQISGQVMQAMLGSRKSYEQRAEKLEDQLAVVQGRLREIEGRTLWQRLLAVFKPH